MGKFETRWDEEYLPIGQIKLFYQALRNISLKWSMSIRDWTVELTGLTIEFGGCLSDI